MRGSSSPGSAGILPADQRVARTAHRELSDWRDRRTLRCSGRPDACAPSEDLEGVIRDCALDANIYLRKSFSTVDLSSEKRLASWFAW
jgi:hypothetical protein